MNVGSLFTGIGGLDHGLHRAGLRHAFMCESDPWRRTILQHHWPGIPIYHDVRGITEPPAMAEGLGLLCGGFPCQDLSVAGRRKGLAGTRSGLFHEYARIAAALRPRWLLVENVPGLLSSNSGRDFGIVLGTLADIGYGLAWRTLDSRWFDVPQRRVRVFVIGCLADGDPRAAADRAGQILAVGTRCKRHPPQGTQTRPNTPVASLSGLGTGGPDDNDGQAGRVIAVPLSHGSNPNSNMAGRRREDDENLVAYALRKDPGGKPGQGYSAVRQGASVRRLTPTECSRLQALPDDWFDGIHPCPDSRVYAALGDAVTSTVAQWIGTRLMEAHRDVQHQ